MPSWPGTLPNKQFLDGLVYAPADQSISTDMETGPPKRRRRFSAAYASVQVPMIVTGTELAAFETFYETTLEGGSLSFTWTDPSDGATVTYQFVGPPAWRPLVPHGTATSRLWGGVLDLVRIA